MFKIHHIALSVKNIKISYDFYRIFGFEKVLDWKSDDWNLEIMHLKLDDFILELFCFINSNEILEESKNLQTDLLRIWVKHFWLKVENLEEIKEKFIKENIAKDIEIKLWRTGIKYFFINDPDWILLEFVEDNRKIY